MIAGSASDVFGRRNSTGHLSLLLLAWPRHDPLAAGGRRPGTGKKGGARGVHRVGGIQGRSEQSKGNKTVALVGFFITGT